METERFIFLLKEIIELFIEGKLTKQEMEYNIELLVKKFKVKYRKW